MTKTSLRKAVGLTLGVSIMSGISTHASALGVSAYFGMPELTTSSPLNFSGNVPYKSWSDYGAGVNLGWGHTAYFYALKIGSDADISNGATYDVNFNLSGTGETSPLLTGGFSLWTSGTTPLQTSVFGGVGMHTFNQVRGWNDDGNTRNFAMSGAYGNVIEGHDGWVAYAQSGASFTNEDSNVVVHGGEANMTSGVVSGYSVDVSTSTNMTLWGMTSGYYLIALGGACPDGLTSCAPETTGGSSSRAFNLTVSAVPIPAAFWLFGGAFASLGFHFRRKQTV